MNTANFVRINISLSAPLAADLKKKVPKRGLSKFLSEAAREKLDAIEREKAFKELLDAPPAFSEILDSRKFIREMRKLDEKRLKRLGV